MKRITIRTLVTLALFTLALLTATAAPAPDSADLAAIAKIKAEGLSHSQVAETLSTITDVYGPRLTGSPGLRKAQAWVQQRLKEWGMENVHLEPWEFGRGWELKHFSASMLQPTYAPLIAYPKAWTPGTPGPVRAEVVQVSIRSEADFDTYRGKLKGLFVASQPAREVPARFAAEAHRYTDEELKAMAEARTPGGRGGFFGGPPQGANGGPNRAAPGGNAGAPNGAAPGGPAAGAPAPGAPQAAAPGPGGPQGGGPGRFGNRQLLRKINEFFAIEKVAGVIEPGRDNGVVLVQSGGGYEKDAPPVAPQIVMATEQYNRICRILEKKIPVQLEIEVAADFLDKDLNAYNLIAEIPGSDKKDEVVMLGGHFDSWHAGTGATDNAAGCVVAMEALRILKATGLQPRRTIRLALWTGEEEGLLGSQAYVREHFATRPAPPRDQNAAAPNGPAPNGGAPNAGVPPAGPPNGGPPGGFGGFGFGRPLTPPVLKPEHAKLSGYFNLDNGTGKIRGIYLQGNEGVRPIFDTWLAPFKDLGATTITIRNTGGTDHQSFDGVGLPGFEFIQDPIDYEPRTHHTNMDVYDRAQIGDLEQAAVVMAAMVYQTAMRDEQLPRKPLPGATPPTAPTRAGAVGTGTTTAAAR